jgi:hypothetical protein
VLRVNNQTGDALWVAGGGLLDRTVFHAEEITVEDVLRQEAGLRLQENGFEVTPRRVVESALKNMTPGSLHEAMELTAQGGLRTNCLYLEIRRWEADVPVHVRTVTANVTAILFDPSSRRVLWRTKSGSYPISTTGDIIFESAYITAARKIAKELLSPLHPKDLPLR